MNNYSDPIYISMTYEMILFGLSNVFSSAAASHHHHTLTVIEETTSIRLNDAPDIYLSIYFPKIISRFPEIVFHFPEIVSRFPKIVYLFSEK